MTKERAKEIWDQITTSPWGWDQDTSKFFRPGEKEEVNEKWKSMPGYTCFADALSRLARGV